MSVLAVSAALAALPSLVSAYSFEFTSTPAQCQDLSLKITGSGGKPPYEVLVVPFGPNPLRNEVRKITRKTFDNNADTTSFKLPFPANTQFIAVVSDASGFGTGGTSASVAVKESSDSSCYDESQTIQPAFVFNIDPPNTIIQCQPTRLWWDKTKVQGSTQFQGVIPSGQSFSIPVGTLSDVDFKGTGFNWTVNVRSSTQLLIVAGDERGMGSAGSADYTVGAGLNPDSSCIDSSSPSNTPGSPAGGSYQTGISGGGTGGGGGGTNVGAIVGGVIGGVVALVVIILVALFFFRRQRLRKTGGHHSVDLLQGDEGEGNQNPRSELPQYYEPEPFIVPDPTVASSEDGHEGNQRPMSMATTSDGHGGLLGPAATSASGSSYGRKSAAGPRSFRAVNIIQHDDAGPSEVPKAEEIETVELPPAYTNIRH